VASAGTIYEDCAQDGCARLCHDEESWFQALDTLTRDPLARFTLVRRAQQRLATEYPLSRLREQVLGVLLAALRAHRSKAEPRTTITA
jgi:hypothetical protein